MVSRILYIHCRVTEEEKNALAAIAARDFRSPSEMMRELIREGLRNRGLSIGDIPTIAKVGRPTTIAPDADETGAGE